MATKRRKLDIPDHLRREFQISLKMPNWVGVGIDKFAIDYGITRTEAIERILLGKSPPLFSFPPNS